MTRIERRDDREPGHEARPPDAVIRRLGPDEWRDLRAIRLRALADAPDAFGSTLERERGRGEAAWRGWLEDGARVVVVAERDGGLVGIASGGPAPADEQVAGLYAMWVTPEARGTGWPSASTRRSRSGRAARATRRWGSG
jgi:hypothetical protein